MEFTIVTCRAHWIPLSSWAALLILLGADFPQGNSVACAQEEFPSRARELARALPLPSRSGTAEPEKPRSKTVSSSNNLLSTTISLGLIVGTLLLVGRWMKRNGFQGSPSLPIEAFELLGRRQIEARTAVHLVKCGNRILVLGVGIDGVRTLSEIRDPSEVEQLTEACHPAPKNDPRVSQSAKTQSKNSTSFPSATTQRLIIAVAAFCQLLMSASPACAQPARSATQAVRNRDWDHAAAAGRARAVQPAAFDAENPAADPQRMLSPQQLGLSLKMLALMTVFSLAPSILMMTTCFVRFTVVLGLLRQALGTQQGPPNQVLTAICLFLTFLVMSPIWQRSYDQGIRPYTNPAAGEQPLDETTALSRTIAPVRGFMSEQIDKAGNADAVWMLLEYQRPPVESAAAVNWHEPESYDEVPFAVLAPAYLLSELKVAFLIGFQLFLPFLVIDLVVATILTSLGLTMLPPSMVSIPFKLLLFVLIDGWFLTVGMLLESVKVA